MASPRTVRRWPGPVAVAALAAALLGCSAATPFGSADALSVRVRLPQTHQGELVVRDGVPVAVRTDSRRDLRVRVRLRLRSGRKLALGSKRFPAVAPGRWHDLVVPLTGSGRRALWPCRPARLVAIATNPGGDGSRTLSARLRADPPTCARFFKPTTFWNTPIPAGAPLDPNSKQISGELLRQVNKALESGPPPTINTFVSTPPIRTVGADTPHVRVHLDRPPDYAPELARAFGSVPLPADAMPAAGPDSELVVWQPATDTLWEFWLLRRATDGWHANWGGRLRNVSTGPGLFTQAHEAWGVTATGLPLAGGTITPRELQLGRIDHALGMGIPLARANWFARPASRTDGRASCPYAIPEGARFRLDPKLDIDALGLPRPVATLARAAQRYGIILRDQSGTVVFYAQNSNSLPFDPYPALFAGLSPQQIAARFPWSKLQLLRMDLEQVADPKIPPPGGFVGCL